MFERVKISALFLSSVLACLHSLALDAAKSSGKLMPMIINGQPAKTDDWAEVVNIEIQLPNQRTAFCSATIVGKKVLVTAAHCGPNGGTAKFKYKGANYTGTLTRSSLYPDRDHDAAVVITSTAIVGVAPRTVGGKSTRGNSVDILGYGCTAADGASDGVLRIGQTLISGFSGFYMVTSSPDGATACRGDSGGPALVTESGKKLLVGINALSNGTDMSYHTRLDIPESQNFLTDIAKTNGVEICGINGVTCSDPVDPNPLHPSCQLTASPTSVKSGSAVTISIVATNATSATIDGVAVSTPAGSRQIVTSSLGRQTSTGEVRNGNEVGTCVATYEVTSGGDPIDRPTCQLTAIPKQVKPNQEVTLELNVFGVANFASIEGLSVSFPVGRTKVSKKQAGDYAVSAFVRGAGGSSNCFADYRVTNEDIPPPIVADFAVTPTHCGPNLLATSGISTVCLALIKKPDAVDKMVWNQVVQIGNADGTTEVLPVVSVKTNSATEQMLTLYTNQTIASQNYRVLETRTASVTMGPGNVPLSIEGRSAKGRYFIVESLTSSSVSGALARAAGK